MIRVSIDTNYYYLGPDFPTISIIDIKKNGLVENQRVIAWQDDDEWYGTVKYDLSLPEQYQWYIEFDDHYIELGKDLCQELYLLFLEEIHKIDFNVYSFEKTSNNRNYLKIYVNTNEGVFQVKEISNKIEKYYRDGYLFLLDKKTNKKKKYKYNFNNLKYGRHIQNYIKRILKINLGSKKNNKIKGFQKSGKGQITLYVKSLVVHFDFQKKLKSFAFMKCLGPYKWITFEVGDFPKDPIEYPVDLDLYS
jgi:hypothetical protein